MEDLKKVIGAWKAIKSTKYGISATLMIHNVPMENVDETFNIETFNITSSIGHNGRYLAARPKSIELDGLTMFA